MLKFKIERDIPVFYPISLQRSVKIRKINKKKKRFYGHVPGICLSVQLPLILRAFSGKTFSGIKVW